MLFPLKFFHSELTPLKSTTVFHNSYSSYWKEGKLVYLVAKGKDLNLEDAQSEIEKFKDFLKGKQYCAIMDLSKTSGSNKAVRGLLYRELPGLFSAVAFFTRDEESMASRDHSVEENAHLPVRSFKKEVDALCWVNQFLSN